MASKSETISISIPLEMFKWLEKKENKRRINRSRLFQDAVDKIRNPVLKKISPMSILIMIFGVTFGVACLAASATMFFSFLFSATLFMIGAVILMASLATMIKETRIRRNIHPVS